MATATTTRPEDLLARSEGPLPDLVEGQLVEREAMGQESDALGLQIGAILLAFAQTTLPALVNGPQAGYQIFSDDPDKVRFPDVSFTRRDRLPNGKPAKGHSKIAPDLVVEVVSPNDLAENLLGKVNDFLAAGVRMVWVVNPTDRTVYVHGAGGPSRPLRIGDRLEGGDVLPGFSCPVAALFEGIG